MERSSRQSRRVDRLLRSRDPSRVVHFTLVSVVVSVWHTGARGCHKRRAREIQLFEKKTGNNTSGTSSETGFRKEDLCSDYFL